MERPNGKGNDQGVPAHRVVSFTNLAPTASSAGGSSSLLSDVRKDNRDSGNGYGTGVPLGINDFQQVTRYETRGKSAES